MTVAKINPSVMQQIESIPNEKALYPNMPVDVYIREAGALRSVANDDRQAFAAVGMDVSLIDQLAERIDALARQQAIWLAEKDKIRQAQREWAEKVPDAFNLKNELEHTFRYAFRKESSLLANVRNIEKGSGNSDLLMDLESLAVLGKNNIALLQQIHFDMSRLDETLLFAKEMRQLLGNADREKLKNNPKKILRDKAYTYLKAAVDEIRETGRFLFWKDDAKLSGYRSNYFS